MFRIVALFNIHLRNSSFLLTSQEFIADSGRNKPNIGCEDEREGGRERIKGGGGETSCSPSKLVVNKVKKIFSSVNSANKSQDLL